MKLVDGDNEASFNNPAYDRRDWLPIIKALGEQEELKPRGRSTEGYIDYLLSEENTNGEELIYNLHDTPHGLWVEYSPVIRQKSGQMLWGTIEFRGTFQNEYVAEKHEEIMKSHATAYIMPAGGYEDELGIISVPEGFNEEELYATVQTAVNMINDAQELQAKLTETAEDYEPSS